MAITAGGECGDFTSGGAIKIIEIFKILEKVYLNVLRRTLLLIKGYLISLKDNGVPTALIPLNRVCSIKKVEEDEYFEIIRTSNSN